MNLMKRHLLLADDDMDDCIFFKEALDELPVNSTLTTVKDGAELMQFLNEKPDDLPDLLFLDLNMPRKTGDECLSEIKRNEKLKHLKVIIFSTSFDWAVVNALYEKGAYYYIRKPAEFSNLKKIIYQALSLTSIAVKKQPAKEKFVLNSE